MSYPANCLDYRNYQLAVLRLEPCNNQSRFWKISGLSRNSRPCPPRLQYRDHRAAISHHKLRPPWSVLISTRDKRVLKEVWHRLRDDRRQEPSPPHFDAGERIETPRPQGRIAGVFRARLTAGRPIRKPPPKVWREDGRFTRLTVVELSHTEKMSFQHR